MWRHLLSDETQSAGVNFLQKMEVISTISDTTIMDDHKSMFAYEK